MVIGTLALLFLFFCNLQFSYGAIGKQGSGPRGTMSYRMQGIFCPSVHSDLAFGTWSPGHPWHPGSGLLTLACWLWLSLQALASASEAWPWDPGGRTYGHTYVRRTDVCAYRRTKYPCIL